MAWISTWWSQVSETVAEGLSITVVGMLLVFFTLGLIILSLILLTKLPGLRVQEKQEDKSKKIPEPAPDTQQVQVAASESAREDDELAQVAAIAVAMLRSRHKVSVRPKAKASANTWKNYGRAHQIGL